VKAIVGFLWVAIGLGGTAYALLTGEYAPNLPIAMGVVLAGVVILLWPERRPRMTVERRSQLLDQLLGVREAEDVIADRFARGLITPDDMIERVWTIREQEIDVMRELGWHRKADSRQADLDMRRSWGTL
jgi:uncharacterized membrane protein